MEEKDASTPAAFYRHLTGIPVPEEEIRIRPVQAPKYGVSARSVGYQLLKKAGWEEGTGLGPEGKGRIEPLEAWFNRGRRGVGCEGQKKPAPKAIQQGTKQKQSCAVSDCSGEPSKTQDEVGRAEKRRRREDVVHRAFLAEFKDAEMQIDSNPLTRSNRLSGSNPLMDD